MVVLTRCGMCGAELDDANESQVVCPACGACDRADDVYDVDWGLFEQEAAGVEEGDGIEAPDDDGDVIVSDDLVREEIEAACLLEGARLALFMTSDDVDGYVIQ